MKNQIYLFCLGVNSKIPGNYIGLILTFKIENNTISLIVFIKERVL
jgi:hypothetical protein